MSRKSTEAVQKGAAIGFVNQIVIVDKNGVEHKLGSDDVCIAIKSEKLAHLLEGKNIVFKGLAVIPKPKDDSQYESIAL